MGHSHLPEGGWSWGWRGRAGLGTQAFWLHGEALSHRMGLDAPHAPGAGMCAPPPHSCLLIPPVPGLSPVPVPVQPPGRGSVWLSAAPSSGYCTGWGDPHYVTFDGLYYSYQGNCTYVLVEEIAPTLGNFGVYIDNYHCDVNDQVSCPRTLIVRYESQEVLLKTLQLMPIEVQVRGEGEGAHTGAQVHPFPRLAGTGPFSQALGDMQGSLDLPHSCSHHPPWSQASVAEAPSPSTGTGHTLVWGCWFLWPGELYPRHEPQCLQGPLSAVSLRPPPGTGQDKSGPEQWKGGGKWARARGQAEVPHWTHRPENRQGRGDPRCSLKTRLAPTHSC